jgi:hypothetical protein
LSKRGKPSGVLGMRWKLSPEIIEKMKGRNLGDKSANWKGGKPKCSECGKLLSSYNSKLCVKCSGKKHSGINNNFYGKKHTPEQIEKMRFASTGRKQSPETIAKRVEKLIGHPSYLLHHTEEAKKKIREHNVKYWLGKHPTKEMIEKNRLAHLGTKASEETKKKIKLNNIGKHREGIERPNFSGINHPNWRGGISENKYPREFNKGLKYRIRARDNFTCCLCEKTEQEELEELNRVLCVNHIDFNKDNNKEDNLNTLCLRCNIKINKQREYWTNHFKIKLWKDVSPT